VPTHNNGIIIGNHPIDNVSLNPQIAHYAADNDLPLKEAIGFCDSFGDSAGSSVTELSRLGCAPERTSRP
jgi:hypothetical protein